MRQTPGVNIVAEVMKHRVHFMNNYKKRRGLASSWWSLSEHKHLSTAVKAMPKSSLSLLSHRHPQHQHLQPNKSKEMKERRCFQK
jgi:hypothetical protein